MRKHNGKLTLEKRRNEHKLIMLHKIRTDKAPTTLQRLCPEPAASKHQHNIRTNENLRPPQANTTLLQKSFFHNTPTTWNTLPKETRNRNTTESFKDDLITETKTDPLYYIGKRKNQIDHARLRLQCSDLRADLYRVNLTDTPTCECGTADEDAHHYLLKCPNYSDLREEMKED